MSPRTDPPEPLTPYLDEPPPRGLFTRLARVGLHIARLQEESMRSVDLRFADYTVLATLHKEQAKDGLAVTRLAELVLRPMGSITQVVDRLERLDLVRRQPDPHDRRMVMIAITEDGEQVATQGESVYDRVHARVLEDMRPDEIDQIDDGIRRLLAALEEDLARADED